MNYTDWNNLPVRSNHVPDLILDDGTEFDFPLRLTDEHVEILRNHDLTILADRKRLSDIDDVGEVLTMLNYEREESNDRVTLGAIGTGEEREDDYYRLLLQIWNAWDRQR